MQSSGWEKNKNCEILIQLNWSLKYLQHFHAFRSKQTFKFELKRNVATQTIRIRRWMNKRKQNSKCYSLLLPLNYTWHFFSLPLAVRAAACVFHIYNKYIHAALRYSSLCQRIECFVMYYAYICNVLWHLKWFQRKISSLLMPTDNNVTKTTGERWRWTHCSIEKHNRSMSASVLLWAKCCFAIRNSSINKKQPTNQNICRFLRASKCQIQHFSIQKFIFYLKACAQHRHTVYVI